MRCGIAAALTATALTVAACGSDSPPADAAGVGLHKVGTFDGPVAFAAPPEDAHRQFVVEQAGRIREIRDGRVLGTPFLDIRDRIASGGEQGLLGLAFAPDYATSRLFYVYYTAKGSGADTLAEFRATGDDRADPASGRVLFAIPDPESNHNGGQLQFGPDGLLYIGIGDGGGANDQHGARGNAQDKGSLMGKILRIDPHASGGRPYTIPSDNPFVGQADARGEIYAYGLRNPWRFSFDKANGALAIADVGQSAVEEIDYAPKGGARGANYGWRPLEGTRRNYDEPAPGAVAPVLQKTHDDGWCSIIGGYVVRDPALKALDGRYVYGDYCKGQLRSVRLRAGRATGDRAIPGVPTVKGLSSFGQDARGRVYVLSANGPVYRFVAR